MSHAGSTSPSTALRAAGVATTLVVTASAVGLTASAAPGTNPPATTLTALTSSGSPLQSAVDQLVSAQQQVNDFNGALGFMTPFDLTRLDGYTQNLSLTMLSTLLHEQNYSGLHDVYLPQLPYTWSAHGADAQQAITGLNPDDLYSQIPVNPSQTYVVTVHPGSGTQDMNFTATSGDGVTGDLVTIPGHQIDLADYTPNTDGSYTIILSSTEQPGNWFDTSGAAQVMIRDTVGNWGLPHDSITIQAEHPTAGYTLPALTDSQITSMLNTITTNISDENHAGTYLGSWGAVATHVPQNGFLPIQQISNTVGGGGIQSEDLQMSSFGRFSLESDQALVIKVPEVDAHYSSIAIADGWGQTAPYATVQGSLNDTNTFTDPDGFTYYVISGKDPGIANWIDNSGMANGDIMLRWQQVTDTLPTTPIQAQVVDVADVRDYLPADTPTVTPDERLVDLQDRLLEYGYRQDQGNDPVGWVTNNLEYDQVKAALGTEQFDQLFGGQYDVPSVLDRMTSSALSPDFGTIAHSFLANPAGSLAAIVNNVPLAIKDIELPMVLAVLRLEMALGSGSGLQDVGTLFSQTFTDPATSITAGLLNARDDLSVALMQADDYSLTSIDFGSVADQLSALQQSTSEMLAAGLNHLLTPLE